MSEPRRGGGRWGRNLLLVLVVLAVVGLRHDFWQWDRAEPLLWGFVPVGLWWQGMVSLAACGMMWLLTRYAWPKGLESDALAGKPSAERGEGE